MNTKRRRLCTADTLRYDPRFRKPCTDDIGEFRGECNFPPPSMVVALFVLLVLISACIAVFAS